MHQEHRQQQRFPVGKQGVPLGLLRTDLVNIPVRITDLSLGGAGFDIESTPALHSYKNLSLHIPFGNSAFVKTPVAPTYMCKSATTGHQHMGVRFKSQKEPFIKSLCAYLVTQYSQKAQSPDFANQRRRFTQVTDQAWTHKVLEYCFRRQRCLKVYESSGCAVGIFSPLHLDDTCIVGSFEGNCQDLEKGQPYYLLLSAFNTAHLFIAPFITTTNGQAVFSFPNEVLQSGARKFGRIRSQDESPVYLEFLHPQIPGKLFRKKAEEIGPGGMRFSLDVEQDLLAPGTVIDAAVIRLNQGQSIACRAFVRHVYCDLQQNYFCGIEFDDFSGNGRQVWVENVLSQMNPNVVEATPFSLDDVWDVFHRSKYLDEKPIERMLPMKEPFFKAWGQLLNERREARCWLCHTSDQTLGTVATSQIYSNTWLAHQMAADLKGLQSKKEKLNILWDMIPRTCFQWLMGSRPGSHIFCYFDAKKQFNQWAWFDFFELFESSQHLDLRRMILSDFFLEDLRLPQVSQDIWVRQSTFDEKKWIFSELRKRDGSFVCDALDLDQKHINRTHSQSAKGSALGLEREIFVAGSDDRTIGYVVLESSTIGANIFSLYNTCRMIVFGHSTQTQYRQIRDALFVCAAKFHTVRKSPSFICLTGTGDASPPKESGGFEAEAVRALISATLIPRWIAYLENIWSFC